MRGVSNKYCLLTFFIAAKPQIDEHASSPESMIVQEDDTLAIWCNVSGTPAPEVTWFRLLGQDDPPVGKGTPVGKHRVHLVRNKGVFVLRGYFGPPMR